MSQPKSRAEELAARLECSTSWDRAGEVKAAAELRRLSAEVEALKAERDHFQELATNGSRECEAIISDVAGYVKASSDMAAEIASLNAEIDRGRSYYEMLAAHRLELVKENMHLHAASRQQACEGVRALYPPDVMNLGITPEEEAEWQRKSDELDARKP